MPIPLSSNHPHVNSSFSPLPNTSTGSSPSFSTSSYNAPHRVHGLDTTTRRYNRLQRRSPLDAHHSPRTRYYSSFAPTNHPNNRTARLHQVHRRGLEANLLSPSTNFVVSRGQLPPSLRQPSPALSESHLQLQQHHQRNLLSALAMESSRPTDVQLDRSGAYPRSSTHPLVRLSSSPAYTYGSSHHARLHDDAYPHRVMTSTPMERSLTNNPALPSHHAPRLPTPETFSSIHRSASEEERESRDRPLTLNFAGPVGEASTEAQESHPQVDDRIHFRLFSEYFPTPSTSITDEDVDMDDELQYIDVQETPEEPEIMFDDDDENIDFEQNSSRMFDQGHGFTSFRVRQGQPVEEGEVIIYDDDEDDGDSDDGIDQILESRQSETSFIPDSPSTPSPSILERPQHAQLSPRSAAALTSMYAIGRSSWPQPLLNSSITPSLAMSRRSREYENNPYFRPAGSGTGEVSSIFAPFPGEEEEEEEVTSFQRPRLTHQDISSSQTHRQSGSNGRGCGESYSVANIEAMGDVWPLKFDMYYADGGEFNAAHSVENVLKNDTSVYCSRRSTNINICLKLAEPNQSFVLTQFKAKAPTTGFTAPCKEGLIFISHQPIPLETTAYFDNMTRQGYDEYMKFIKDRSRFGRMLEQHGPAADAMVPAAFFQMDGAEDTCTLDFTPNRSGRFVLIKLLRSRCTNSLQRPENIDLQYLGLIGFTGARSFASGSLL